MPCKCHIWKAVGIASDQLVNAHFGGWPDETLSSRAYRLSKNGRHLPRKVIDTLFFWDRDRSSGKRHCELSFESEREGRQVFPPEAREGMMIGNKELLLAGNKSFGAIYGQLLTAPSGRCYCRHPSGNGQRNDFQ